MQIDYHGYTCKVNFSIYSLYQNPAIQLIDANTGEPFATLSVNPDEELPEGTIAINAEQIKEKDVVELLIDVDEEHTAGSKYTVTNLGAAKLELAEERWVPYSLVRLITRQG